MSKYSAAVVIEDSNGEEICREGDRVRIVDSSGTVIVGAIDKIDYEDGQKNIFFDGWNVKVVLPYVESIEKVNEEEVTIEELY